MNYRAVVWSLCSLLLLWGCSSAPLLQPLPPDAVVLAFGDSLTAGTGATPETSYPAVLSRLIGRTVVNAGIPGEVTAAGLARLAETLDREKPALVLLCLGGNDFLQRLDQAKTGENLRSMVRMMRERGVAVVLIGVPRLGFGVDVPGWYAELAKEAGVPYEGKLLKRILADRSLKSDPIHPNAAGYQQLAEGLAAVLKKNGALPK
ncbi:arylesterase [Trichlorobacter lovleyi]|uniref:arylesterase n=1 Tax=Trichlorobacter lovleyi TaxID=313985 RepID=UPI003D0BD185